VAGRRWLVDGMNVIGSRPDGWWRDRERAWRRLAGQLAAYARETGEEVRLVLDGRRPGDWPDEVETTFARGRRGAADDAIVELVSSDPDPGSLVVVTSDRELVARVRALGAEVEAASGFRSELEKRPE
jgi:predicted RNA-binding protein with PIN domain